MRKHINKSYIISGEPQREERWQYPIPAIREIAINMIVHRDYPHYGDSSIKIFNDRIEFFNPGKLPDDISIAKLLSGQYISQARNKKIAATFKEAQLIEKYGSGIKRIQEAFADYGLKAPLFENMQHGFQVTVYSAPEKTSEKTSAKTSEKILLMVTQNPLITIAELAANIGISNRSIERNIGKLQKEKKLERIGADKGGFWQAL